MKTPAQQHEEHARKILARRGSTKNNETAITKPVKKIPPSTTSEVKLTRKELRDKCVDAGIAFKKKDTIEILLEKLK